MSQTDVELNCVVAQIPTELSHKILQSISLFVLIVKFSNKHNLCYILRIVSLTFEFSQLFSLQIIFRYCSQLLLIYAAVSSSLL